MAMAVVGVVVGTVLPASAPRWNAAISGAAAQLKTDILFTRSQAVAVTVLRMRFSGRRVARGARAGDACDFSRRQRSLCRRQPGLRSVGFARPAGRGQRQEVLQPQPRHQHPTGTLKLTGREARSVQLVVNLMGRVGPAHPVRRSSATAC
jgi:hypothetical protein